MRNDRKLKILAGLTAILIYPASAHAEIYRCNSNGKLIYSDRPCNGAVRKEGDKWVDVGKENEAAELLHLKKEYRQKWDDVLAPCASEANESVSDDVSRLRDYYVKGMQLEVPGTTEGEILSNPAVIDAIKNDSQVKEKYLKVYTRCAEEKKPALDRIMMDLDKAGEAYKEKYGELPDGF